MKLCLVVYLILTIVFFIDIVLSITVLEFVRQAVSVKERPKLVQKIDKLKKMKKYVLVWPYILYRLIRNDVS